MLPRLLFCWTAVSCLSLVSPTSCYCQAPVSAAQNATTCLCTTYGTVWDSFTANNIKALEKFQKWAVRWVKQDYSTSSIEDQCVWTTCENNCTGSGRKQAHSHLTTLELQVPPWSHPHQIKHCPSPANRPRRTTWNHLTYPDLMYDIPSHQTELYRQKTFFQSGTAFLKK